MKRRSLLQATSAAVALPTLAFAQDKYPSKPITWVCPYAAGGNADNRSRQVARVMSTLLGQPIIIDGHIATVTEMIMRQWATSKDPRLVQAFIQYAYGKVPDQTEVTGKDGEALKFVIVERSGEAD